MKDADVYGYDEHVRGVAREVVTVETKINSSNKGFAMLAKMGWTEGTGLGTDGTGRVEPMYVHSACGFLCRDGIFKRS